MMERTLYLNRRMLRTENKTNIFPLPLLVNQIPVRTPSDMSYTFDPAHQCSLPSVSEFGIPPTFLACAVTISGP